MHDLVSVCGQAAPEALLAVVTANVRVAVDAPQVVLQAPHWPHAPTQSTGHKLNTLDRRVPTTCPLLYPHTIRTFEQVVLVRPDTVRAMEVAVVG